MRQRFIATGNLFLTLILCAASASCFELPSFKMRAAEMLSKRIAEVEEKSLCDRGTGSGRRLLQANFGHLAGTPISSTIISQAESQIVSAFGKKPICFLIWSKSVTDSSSETKYYIYETPGNKFTSYAIKSTLTTSSTPSKVIYKNSYDVNTLEQAVTALGHNVIYKPRVDPVWTLQSTSLETSSDLKTKMTLNIPITRPRGVLVYFSTLTQEEGDRESVPT